MTPPGRLRLFIAVDPDRRLRAALTALRKESSLAKAGWVRAESLHLTLRFLGDLPEDYVEKIAAVMLSVSGSVTPFSLHLRGLGAFPRPEQGKVLWAGLDPDPALFGLHRQLDAGLAAIGLPRDPRPFVPHLTLARLKAPADLTSLIDSTAGRSFGTLAVDTIRLYQSCLAPGGAIHTLRAAARLGGPHLTDQTGGTTL